jgi:hypothetical protein
MKKEYLSEEEQFKEILNNEEISRIEDYELREIRSKYWNKFHKAFLDEINIPDRLLGDVMDKIRKDEKVEIEAYKIRKQIKV